MYNKVSRLAKCPSDIIIPWVEIGMKKSFMSDSESTCSMWV